MTSANQVQLTVPVTADDHQQGPEDAPVTLVEYGDFQCSYCGEAYPVVQQVQEAMGDGMRFVYRHFPLTEIHENAGVAAEASESAAAQGAFWPYHDRLFEHQDALSPSDLVAHAEALGLDAAQVEQDLESGARVEPVREDFMGGVRSDVNGTPTFFINGRRYDGPPDPESLLDALKAAARG
jgi:protein-disulfide isomerase